MLERHPKYLQLAIRRGILHASKFGRDWMLTPADIDEYRAQHMRHRHEADRVV
jgi:hypothetical protein